MQTKKTHANGKKAASTTKYTGSAPNRHRSKITTRIESSFLSFISRKVLMLFEVSELISVSSLFCQERPLQERSTRID